MTNPSVTILPKRSLLRHHRSALAIQVSPWVVEAATLDTAAVLVKLASSPQGLSSDEAAVRLATHGPNVLAKDHPPRILALLLRALVNPLVILLAVLAAISFATGDFGGGAVMVSMIGLSVGLKLVQESRAGNAAAKLKAMISVTATVLRGGVAQEIAVAHLVPGDVIRLAAGDMIPGDVRITQAKDLFVSQGSLTGESFPVEKFEEEKHAAGASTAPIELTSIAFLGSSVESGSASAIVVTTGKDTYLGSMAQSMAEEPSQTAFDRGISQFTWLMLRFMLVMVPLVFLINGLTKGSWVEAFFFAVAVAVGLTPEMLPMIVTVCLSKGAVTMGAKKVVVKRLNAIQNLGAMDVLCTDKTGTLTLDKVTLERHCNVMLKDDEGVLALAYLNSQFQTGLKSILDRAILAKQADIHTQAAITDYSKVDEIPFDFQRRIMSVVVRAKEGDDRIISKGAPEEIFSRCKSFALDGVVSPLNSQHIEALRQEHERLSADGFRVLAIATRDLEPRRPVEGAATPYGKADECELVLHGYVAFLDPPKESAAAAITDLQTHGVLVKVLTGDNELVARKICREVGLATESVLLGEHIEAMNDEQLAEAAGPTTLFARVSPAHKQRIIKALQARHHTVGYMGDGINDAPALHAADVGISVDTAVDIAKESADLILLEKSLLVLGEGVLEGRAVFSNIIKYVRMGASSNFGNMFSVLGASLFVPFLPMLPVQILANNLLYDISQTAIPTDTVDPERTILPRKWDMKEITRFVLLIGPCSSIFDYTTFFLMLYLFKCWNVSTPAAAAHSASVFQTGWFIESLLTQTLIIHVIRTNKIPFIQSRASLPLTLLTFVVMAVGVAIPLSPLGHFLGFSSLPALFWPFLALTIACYMLLTQGVKMWLLY